MPGPSGIRLAVVDDHPAIRLGTLEGLKTRLELDGDAVSVGTVADLLEEFGAEDLTGRVVLLDISLHDGSEPEDNVAGLVAAGLNVLLYTQDSRPGVVARCLRAGALGIVGKDEDLDVLADAVRAAALSEPHLNVEWASAVSSDSGWVAPALAPREIEALRLYATGIALKSVARRMNISPETVREYLVRIRRKYQQAGRPASSKAALYIRAVEDGHLPSPGSR